MKNIFIVLTLVLYGFISNSYAEEIKMKCTYSGDSYYGDNDIFIKYSKPLIGKKNIEIRWEGDWVKWCGNEAKQNIKNNWKGYDHLPDDLMTWQERKIKNRGGVCIEPNDPATDRDKAKVFVCSNKVVLDFEEISRSVKIDCEYGSDFSKEEKWDCEKFD